LTLTKSRKYCRCKTCIY